MRRRLWLVAVVMLAGVALYGVSAFWRAESGLAAAKDLVAHGLWPQARDELRRYLWWHPGNGEARLLMAESLVKDPMLPGRDAATAAIAHLRPISVSGPHAAQANLQQARLTFLMLQQPAQAEQLLAQVIAQDPDHREAHLLLWSVFNATGRAELAERIFWRAFELSSTDEKPLRLREWYLSQFFPLGALESLDQALGVLAPGESANRTAESRRYIRFRELEPTAPIHHAALAQWAQQEGDPQLALQILDRGELQAPTLANYPLALGVRIAAQIDLGRLDEARDALRRWPDADREFLYWRSQALVLDEVERQPQTALDAYDRALAIWPGPVDWRLRFRLASCFTRLGRHGDAERVRQEVRQIQSLLDVKTHEQIRAVLGELNVPRPLAIVASFYQGLGREREASFWRNYCGDAAEPPPSDR